MIQSRTAPTPSSLLPHVVGAVTEAGALIRAEFHRQDGPRGAHGHAPIDTVVETLLRERLRALHACSWRGEETGSMREDGADVWVVDPQDGTTDFLAGRRGSAISVALLRDGRPVLGVVYAALAPDDDGDLFAWGEGEPLTRNGQPVERPMGGQEPSVVALNADAADYALHNHLALPGLRIRALPSPAYRLALAAAGEADAAISLTRGLASWDVAGGHALLLGAGGVLVDRHGRSISYANGTIDGCIGGQAAVVARLVAMQPGRGRAHPRGPAQPKARVSDATLLARAQGCLLGQLAGDALGSAVEFRPAADIARQHPQGVRVLRDGGTWNLIAGQPTDDGEMALALARSLVARGHFDSTAVGRRTWRGVARSRSTSAARRPAAYPPWPPAGCRDRRASRTAR